MMLHRIILVLTLLVAVGCTGDDTVKEVEVEIEKIKIQCPNGGPLIEEGGTCPSSPSGNQGGSTGGQTDTSDTSEPGRSDCIKVQDVDLEGTDQDDVICGDERDNTIDGRAGDDTIYGGAGDDLLIGGAGNFRDTLKGEAGNDTLRGDEGIDILDGGAGTDTADYSKENVTVANDEETFNGSPVEVNLAEGQATDTHGDEDKLIAIENVIGTEGLDTIIGDSGPNEIDGGDGVDTIEGRGGNDILRGGAGNDIIKGEEGNDTIYPGEDQVAENEDTSPRVDGGPGNDTLVAVEATVDMAATDNWFTGFENLTDGSPAGTAALTGNEKNNVLTGGKGANTLTGGEGIDTLRGLGGTDTLVGGPGKDILEGGDGADNLTGGTGADRLTGGGGGDCFAFDATHTDVDTVMDFNAGDGDSVKVMGTPVPVTAANEVAVKVAAGRIILEETDPDNNDRLVRTTTLVNVRGLKATDTFEDGACL